MIVVITDGVDEGSRKTRDQATREAQLADTVVYSIDYSDPGAMAAASGSAAEEEKPS